MCWCFESVLVVVFADSVSKYCEPVMAHGLKVVTRWGRKKKRASAAAVGKAMGGRVLQCTGSRGSSNYKQE